MSAAPSGARKPLSERLLRLPHRALVGAHKCSYVYSWRLRERVGDPAPERLEPHTWEDVMQTDYRAHEPRLGRPSLREDAA